MCIDLGMLHHERRLTPHEAGSTVSSYKVLGKETKTYVLFNTIFD